MLLGMFVIFQSSSGCFHSTCDLTRRLDGGEEDEEIDVDDEIGFAEKLFKEKLICAEQISLTL